MKYLPKDSHVYSWGAPAPPDPPGWGAAAPRTPRGGYSGPGFASFQAQMRPDIDDFLSDPSKFSGPCYVVALWAALYIENKRFDLDTLRLPNRSPTPISKSNDFRGQSDGIWGPGGGSGLSVS